MSAVRARKAEWAQLPIPERVAILQRCLTGYLSTAEEVVAEGCRATGLDPHSVQSGEGWLSGPVAVVRHLRLFIETLSDIQRTGYPSLRADAVHRAPTGELAVVVFPRTVFERVMYPGTRLDVWMQPEVTERTLRDTMASSYRAARPPGKVVLVLGAGNVASIAPNDVLYKLLVEHAVVVLKMHPVNEYLGPLLERAFEPLITPGYLRIVYGDAAEGQHLIHHPDVDEVHMTGSTAVHDRIVWGDNRRDGGSGIRDPKVHKPITSELGCVTPTIVVPGRWPDAAMQYHAENVATMVAHGASTTCIAAKVLVTWRGWPQRKAFLDRVRAVLAQQPPRLAFYPGAAARYAAFTGATPKESRFACAAMFDLDPSTEHMAFKEEAWSPVLAETGLEASTAAEFIDAAVRFCNERIFGTLSVGLFVPPDAETRLGSELDRAIADLHYGTVSINHWSGMNFVLGNGPWGAYPGHTIEDVGSGIGVVHNTLMFDRPLKTIVRGPFTVWPKPPWFVTHRRGHVVARRMAAFEASPSLWGLLGVAAAALRA